MNDPTKKELGGGASPHQWLGAWWDRNRVHMGITLLICVTVLAWMNRFIQDDAFISFRYADNLVNGQGLTWNEDERVEGYSNFLWVVCIAVLIWLHGDPVVGAQVLGLVCFVVTVLGAYQLAKVMFGSTDLGMLVILLLGTNYTFSAYATGGLETQLQACLLVWTALGVVRAVKTDRWEVWAIVGIPLGASAALLTRLDSAIVVFFLYAALCVSLVTHNFSFRKKLSILAVLIVPVLVIVGTWLRWKLHYYGDILPNTYYVKAATTGSFLLGVKYLYKFFTSYWLIPFILLVGVSFKEMVVRREWWLVLWWGIVGVWFLYIVKVGGGFMEFRFLVPVMAFMFIGLAWVICRYVQQRGVQIALVGIILLGSLNHALMYKNKIPGGIEAIPELHSHVSRDGHNWVEVGKVLGRMFGDLDHDVTIGTTAAGAIPFYSALHTVDMHGLNDKWVAKHGIKYSAKPGHQRLAPFEYLLKKNVNLVIGPPHISPNHGGQDHTWTFHDLEEFELADIDPAKWPKNSKIIEIPIDRHIKLTVVYLVHNTSIEDVIHRFGLRTFPIAAVL